MIFGENEKKKEFQMKDRRGSSISSYELSVKIRWTRTQQKESRKIKRGDLEDEDKINFNEYLLVCVLSPLSLRLFNTF